MVTGISEHTMHPALTAAMQLIAYDNGAVNRFQTVELVKKEVRKELSAEFTDGELAAVEAELSTLNQQQLEDACIGEQGNPVQAGLSDLTNTVLDRIMDALP